MGERALPGWYEDAKFGIFVHWGPYAVPCFAPVDHDMGDLLGAADWAQAFRGSPYTEWYLNSWSLEGSDTARHHADTYGPDVTYADFVAEFRERSSGVDAGRWAELFADAGARYVVPVTKHHDGYLMWPGALPNPHRPGWGADRDHVGELADACRAAGLRFGTYYSGGLDWTFSPPPIDSFAALIANIPRGDDYAAYATAHVHELIDRYRPDVLWNDIAWPRAGDPAELISHYYARVPDGVVNDRFDMVAVAAGRLHADFVTPEYSTRAPAPGAGPAKWEVCRGIGRSFGYNRMETDSTLSSADELIWMLVDVVARGGNLLLNVGPSADGQIPLAQALRLTAMGWWLRVHGDAVHGTRPAAQPCSATADGREVRATTRGAATYLAVRGAPSGVLRLPGRAVGQGAEVRMLGNDRVLPHTCRGDELVVQLPDHLPPSPATVLAVSS